ncbi:hypothetical protein LZ32DRAFT_537561 [Colletotrichum eremochloae]|nr:hypothetical protein LZ32DRAFT_537561 [Colletotrichum eremochloae]
MRVALGEIGSNLGLPSIGAAPLEYLKKAVGATKATGLAGSHRGKLLNQLGSLLNGIFARTRDQTTFEEAMQVTKDAVSATVGDTTEHATALINVCNRLSERYDQTGSRNEDLEDSLNFNAIALDGVSLSDPNRPLWQNNMGMALGERYSVSQDINDLEDSIRLTEESLQVINPMHVARKGIIFNLAIRLRDRFLSIGSREDLDRAISLFRQEALQEPDIDLPNRQLFMSYLATCFEHRFSNTSDLSDLNELIDFNREAMKLLPEDGDSNFRQLGNLSGALRNRFNRIGQMVDLDEAIQATREMLTKIPTQESDNRVAAMVNLAGHLVLKFFRTKNIEDLNQAISLSHQTISIDHSNRFLRLNNCGSQLLERFRHTRQISDLNESIALLREATLGKKDHHPNFLDLLTNLAFALEQRHRQFHEMGDLDEAVHLGRQSAQETSDDHPMKATRLFQFGLDIQHKYVHSKRPDDLHEAKEAFLDGLNNEKGDVTIRIAAGREFLKLCDINNDGQRAFSVAETIVNLIPLTASLSQRPSDKQYFLSQVAGSASDAAAIALHVGKRPASVIQLLETGRGVIAGTLQDLRVDVTVLEKSDADLANRFVKLRNTLDTPRNPRHNASMQLSSILDEIRRVSGFETFLLAGTDDQMTEAAANGHIIIINVSSYRCDALVIGHRFVQALELPNLKLEDIISRSNTLDSIDTLEWLWDVAIGPVLDLLGFTRTPAEGNAWPHVWWIPTGPLVRFPLHAAGHHLRGTHEAALDRVVSSYSVSVKAITNTRKQHLARGDGSECGLDAILVSMPETPGQGSLQYAKSEIDEVEKLCSAMGLTCTQPEANQHDVLTALDRCRVFHFAGHGGTHPTDPLSSLLLLKDYQTRPLTVGSLLDKNLQSKRPFLAYLSACGTGQIKDTTSVDESIHLTSAFQLAGFRHVVGTLWSVDDEVCLDVARATYEAIREHGFEDSSVSLGLHQGLRSLRDKWVASQKDPVGSERDIAVLSVSVKDRRLLWVPYVHFGV